jgi:hypothetical protein
MNMNTLGNLPISNTALQNFSKLATTNPAPAPTWLDRFSNTASKIGTIAQTGAGIVSNVKGTISTIKTPGPAQQGGAQFINQGAGLPPEPEKKGLSTGVKIALAVTGATLLAGGVYLATRPKKKSLGELNTAKTKKGKAMQRAAVFAKLDEAGETYPKNKSGKRKPRRKK